MDYRTHYLAQAAPAGGTGLRETQPAPQLKTESNDQGGQSAGLGAIWLPLAFVLIFYFVLIRPQQRKEKQRQKTLKQLKKNDKVVTRGGLVGIVSSLKEDEGIAIIKLGEHKIEMMINAIELVNPEFQSSKAKE